MTGNEDIQNLRDAIARGLSSSLAVERNMPDRLKSLLHRLEEADETSARHRREMDLPGKRRS
jgi:hypothetical protein